MYSKTQNTNFLCLLILQLRSSHLIGVNIAQAYSTGTRMYDEDAQLKTEMTKNHMDT